MNKLLAASFFTPSQTGTLIAIAVVILILIVLNIVLFCVFHKRGERKLYDRLLQKQRELLMRQLSEMRGNGDTGLAESQQAFFTNTVYVQVPVPAQESDNDTASVEVDAPVEEVDTTVSVVEETDVQCVDDTEIAVTECTSCQDSSDATFDFDDDSDDVEEVVVVNGHRIRYNRSFKARIIQSSEEVKDRYSDLKNYMLSYKGVKNRISWKHETFRIGKNSFAIFVVRGKTLCLCLATDASAFDDTKYKVEDLSIRSPKAKFPCLYRLNNPLRLKYAKEIVDIVMAELGVAQLEDIPENDYKLPYQPTEDLIEEGLIKVTGEVVEVDANKEKSTETVIETVSALSEEVVNEVPAEEVHDEVVEVATEALTEEVSEEVAAEVSEESLEEVREEVSEETADEENEAIIEEIAGETSENSDEGIIENDVLPKRDFEILAEVDVNKIDALSDSDAEQLVEVKIVKKQKVNRKNKGIVNIDFLSKNYEAGAHVTIDSLHKKGLVANEIKTIKVLARGVIDKPLIVEADDFSLEAVKMIVLTGGRVIRKEIQN